MVSEQVVGILLSSLVTILVIATAIFFYKIVFKNIKSQLSKILLTVLVAFVAILVFGLLLGLIKSWLYPPII